LAHFQTLMRIFRRPANNQKDLMQINDFLPLDCGIEELVKQFASLAAKPQHALIAHIVKNRALEKHTESSEIHTEMLALIREYVGGGYIYGELQVIDPSYHTPEEDAYISDDKLYGLPDLMDADEAMTR
jgi:hypothetical protein